MHIVTALTSDEEHGGGADLASVQTQSDALHRDFAHHTGHHKGHEPLHSILLTAVAKQHREELTQ